MTCEQFQALDNAEINLEMCLGVLTALASHPNLAAIGTVHLGNCLALVTEKLEEAKLQVAEAR